MGQVKASEGVLWEIMGENPTPSPVVTTSIVSPYSSYFSTPTTVFFSSSSSLHLSIIYCIQIKIFKANF